MIDIKLLRDTPKHFEEMCTKRGLDVDLTEILTTDENLRTVQTKLQDLQHQKNLLAQEMAQAKRQGDATEELQETGVKIRTESQDLEEKKTALSETLHLLLSHLPNLIASDVPTGQDETDNALIRTWGEPQPLTFAAKSHDELGVSMGLMDFESAVKMSGSRFVVLKGDLAKLERALAHFMLDIHTTKFGYEEISPPLLVRDSALFATGQLPKFGEESFQTTTNHWLIPTAEVSLTNLAADQIYDQDQLSLRYVAYTPCFRSEAGAAGRDTRGIIRLHQFNKVELVSFVPHYMAEQEHQRMLSAAEYILQALEIPYRVMLLCSGDLGFHAQKTYDLEAWIPSQNTYREISSCSSFGDYQSRRLKARYRPLSEGKKTKPEFIHTLNGSGLAVGRTLVALLENYQQEDGSIVIPPVLHSYMNGKIILS
ncbi:MAG: serine--tRNA ligase [Alphaproteobacteria bacterium]|nr:MAG: serine--tRNA ligase [Alphaproteobacteria bacterium]